MGDRLLVFSVFWAPLWVISLVTVALFSLPVFLFFPFAFDATFLLLFLMPS